MRYLERVFYLIQRCIRVVLRITISSIEFLSMIRVSESGKRMSIIGSRKKPRLVVERNWRENMEEVIILFLVFALVMNMWILYELRSFRKWLECEFDAE